VNLRQEPIEVEATGWLARIFQHEFDHLEGTLYVDKLESRYLPEVDEITERRGWGKPGKTWIPGLDNLED
jgi:peptide deformylase